MSDKMLFAIPSEFSPHPSVSMSAAPMEYAAVTVDTWQRYVESFSDSVVEMMLDEEKVDATVHLNARIQKDYAKHMHNKMIECISRSANKLGIDPATLIRTYAKEWSNHEG